MELPSPSPDQAFCKVSALEGGLVTVPVALFLEGAELGAMLKAPSIAFLLRHTSRTEDNFLFDLGIHKNWAELAPEMVAQAAQTGSNMEVGQDVPSSLGGAKVAYACVSHIHVDHIGDPADPVYASTTFLIGADARSAPERHPHHTQQFANELFAALPKERTRFLEPEGWAPLGPFPHALDFFGDGSLYIVDAPGHLPGHLNVLARTSADGGWIYLAGDSAHHWSLITGEGKMSRTPVCAHVDPEAAEAQIERIKVLMKNERVRIILAHDVPWYEKNKGGAAYWPGVIQSL